MAIPPIQQPPPSGAASAAPPSDGAGSGGNSGGSAGQQPLMLPALRRLLRPLVRLMIAHGITFPVLADTLRSLYVDVASHDVLEEERARTDSRVSLLSGVHRKEIRRLREGAAQQLPPASPALTLSSQILARWLGLPGYSDAEGRPLPLPRTPPADAPAGTPSFDALVAGVTTDVRPRAVLDSWLNQGLLHQDSDGLLRLDAAALVPPSGSGERLYYFARNLHDHIAAAAANLDSAGTSPFLERSVHYGQLTPEAARILESSGRLEAQKMLLEINRQALAVLEQGGDATRAPARNAPSGTAAEGQGVAAPARRVNLGVYLYVEDEPAASKAQAG